MTFLLHTSCGYVGWDVSDGKLQAPALKAQTVEGAHGAGAVQRHIVFNRDVS